MQIKNLLLLLACVVATKSFAQDKPKENPIKYHISGAIPGFKSSYIYCEALGVQEVMKLDSMPNVGGKFDFSGSVSEKSLFRVRAGNDYNATVMFIISEKKNDITINGDSAAVAGYSYRVTGSKATEQLRVLLKNAMANYGNINAASKLLQQPLADPERQRIQSEIDVLTKSNRAYLHAYTDTVKNPVLTVFSALSFINPDEDLLQLKKVKERLKVQGDTTFGLSKQFISYVNTYADSYEQVQPKAAFNVGDELPDIALKDTSGNVIKLSSLRGKYVLVDFWASWCGPCRMENPNIVETYQLYKDKGFTVFGVSLDNDRNRWVKAIKSDKLTWPHVSELKGWSSAVCQQFSIFSIPSSFLIDPQGKIVALNLRGDDLQKTLANLIK